MSAEKWTQLAQIADARFQKEAQRMQALQQEQESLSARQTALTQMASEAKDAFRNVHVAHYHSGDVQWQSWVGRNTAQLNMEAARLLARRAILLPTLRRAFAQKQACDEIAKSLSKKRSGYG